MGELKLKVQLYCGGEVAMGPGKAALLEAIESTGSISAAGRALGMSYRRTWLLVDTMNRCFRQPLVEARAGAGAQVSAAGEAALAAYEEILGEVEGSSRGRPFMALEAMLRTDPV